MEVDNLKHWYDIRQVKTLTGFKYHMQVSRWRKAEYIPYFVLCNLGLYFRESVNEWLRNKSEMFEYRVRKIEGQTRIYSMRKYNAARNLEIQILSQVAYNLDLTIWQPYCMLPNEPDRMALSRLSNQRVVPQVRTKSAYGLTFYNVEDIRREFK